MKIVSLLPSATELVFALGLEDRLEGVTFECDFPPEAASKPVISTSVLPSGAALEPAAIDALVNEHMEARTPLYRLDRDRIAAIQPDVILTQDLCRVCAIPSGHVEDALEELGCTSDVISMDPRTLDDVLETFLAVGKATGTEGRADELVTELRRRIDAVRERTSDLRPVRTAALEWVDPPFIGGHWVPDMVAVAGGEPVLNEPGGRSSTVSWRDVADARPEVVVYMPCGFGLADAVTQGAEVVAALRGVGVNAPVYAADGSAYFSRPGPRLVDGIEILAWALNPEILPEPPEGVRRLDG